MMMERVGNDESEYPNSSAADRRYDRLLRAAMTAEQIVLIEQQRELAHRAFMRRALAAALDGWERPGRM